MYCEIEPNPKDQALKQLIRRQDPWHRLHMNRTLTHYYKTLHFDPSTRPGDDLDLRMKSDYDQFMEFNAPHRKVVHQTMEHCCPGRLFVKDEPVPKSGNQPFPSHLLYVSTHPRRDLLDHVQNSIDRPHVIHTNAGFSRKTDGGRYVR